MVLHLIGVAGTACCLASLQDCDETENQEPDQQIPPDLATVESITNAKVDIPKGLKDDRRRSMSVQTPMAPGSDKNLVSRVFSKVSYGCDGTSAFSHPQSRMDGSGHEQNPNGLRLRAQLRSVPEREEEQRKLESISKDHTRTVGLSPGYVDGLFAEGKARNIVPPSECFVIKFSPDSSLLAVGLKKGEGVAIYETTNFSVALKIERHDTVSAMDWLWMPSSKSLLLAVGGFDGIVTVYSINKQLIELEGSETVLQAVRFDSEIRALKFMNGSGTDRIPLHIAIGEKNGQLHFLRIPKNGVDGDLQNVTQNVQKNLSAVLSIEFSKSGELMASGLKDGKVRVHTVKFNNERVKLGHRLCEINKNGAVYCLAFSPDSLTLVAGGYDKSLTMIDTKIWDVIRELRVEGTVSKKVSRKCETNPPFSHGIQDIIVISHISLFLSSIFLV